MGSDLQAGRIPGKTVNRKRLAVWGALLVLFLAAGGCAGTRSPYEKKTREADVLREEVARVKKENSVLAARNESLQGRLAIEKDSAAKLSARLQAQEAENRRMSERPASARKSSERTPGTRESSELLEKEKAAGKRIQELNARVQACELALDALQKESSARESGTATGADSEALERERDILLGRVGRLTEDRRQGEKRRDDRLAALTKSIGEVSNDVTVARLGPAVRVLLPEKVLFAKGKTTLSEGTRKVVAEVGKVTEEFPMSSILLSTGGRKLAADIRTALIGSRKIPRARIHLIYDEKEKGVELVLLVP